LETIGKGAFSKIKKCYKLIDGKENYFATKVRNKFPWKLIKDY